MLVRMQEETDSEADSAMRICLPGLFPMTLLE